jgi:hypothetical protein
MGKTINAKKTHYKPYNVIKLLYRLAWINNVTIDTPIQRVKYRLETNAFWNNDVINDSAMPK